jgi:hypothetical protein
VSAYNTVSATLKCPACGLDVTVPVQFKFGNTRQLHYEVGDILRWGGNDIGDRGKRRVVIDGVVAGRCPKCMYDDEWNVYVHVENDRIVRVESATGEFDFVTAGLNFIVLE